MRSLLLIATLGMLLGGHALAEGNTLMCTARVPVSADCSYEATAGSLGAFEAAYGVTVLVEAAEPSVTPYGLVAYYGEATSIWVEVRTPKGILPYTGEDAFLIFGFTTYW